MVEVTRAVFDYQKPPAIPGHKWTQVITKAPSVPFQHLKNAGIFPDDNGNIPPRKMP